MLSQGLAILDDPHSSCPNPSYVSLSGSILQPNVACNRSPLNMLWIMGLWHQQLLEALPVNQLLYNSSLELWKSTEGEGYFHNSTLRAVGPMKQGTRFPQIPGTSCPKCSPAALALRNLIPNTGRAKKNKCINIFMGDSLSCIAAPVDTSMNIIY